MEKELENLYGRALWKREIPLVSISPDVRKLYQENVANLKDFFQRLPKYQPSATLQKLYEEGVIDTEETLEDAIHYLAFQTKKMDILAGIISSPIRLEKHWDEVVGTFTHACCLQNVPKLVEILLSEEE